VEPSAILCRSWISVCFSDGVNLADAARSASIQLWVNAPRSRTGCLGDRAHRTLANHPDPADLARVARVQALIATTT
jgi:hypothetical protein